MIREPFQRGVREAPFGWFGSFFIFVCFPRINGFCLCNKKYITLKGKKSLKCLHFISTLATKYLWIRLSDSLIL